MITPLLLLSLCATAVITRTAADAGPAAKPPVSPRTQEIIDTSLASKPTWYRPIAKETWSAGANVPAGHMQVFTDNRNGLLFAVEIFEAQPTPAKGVVGESRTWGRITAILIKKSGASIETANISYTGGGVGPTLRGPKIVSAGRRDENGQVAESNQQGPEWLDFAKKMRERWTDNEIETRAQALLGQSQKNT